MLCSKPYSHQFMCKVAVILIGVIAYSNLFSAELPAASKKIKMATSAAYDGSPFNIYFQDTNNKNFLKVAISGYPLDEERIVPIQDMHIKVIDPLTDRQLDEKFFNADVISNMAALVIKQNGEISGREEIPQLAEFPENVLQYIIGYLPYYDNVNSVIQTSKRMSKIGKDVLQTEKQKRYWAGRIESIKINAKGGSSPAFSPDRNYLAFIGGSTKAKILRFLFIGNMFLPTGKNVFMPTPPALNGVSAFAFSPDNNLLVAVVDGMVKVWAFKTNTVTDLDPKGYIRGIANSVAFSADSTLLAVGYNEAGVIDLWEMPSKKFHTFLNTDDEDIKLNYWGTSVKGLLMDGNVIVASVFDPDVESVGRLECLRIWDVKNHRVIGKRDSDIGTVISSKYNTFVNKFRDNQPELWTIKLDGSLYTTVMHQISLPRGEGPFALSLDGRQLAHNLFRKMIHLTRVPNGEVLTTLLFKALPSMAFSSDGKLFAAIADPSDKRTWIEIFYAQ